MNRILLAAAMSIFTVLLPRETYSATPGLVIEEGKPPHPWTSLEIIDGSRTVRFAVLADRNGGYRAGVFPRAIEKVNALGPQFVMTVGDHITGYMEDRRWINRDWEEFGREVGKLRAPFFYTPGNHDLTNAVLVEEYLKRFGRTYYHFTYQDILFLSINSEDGKQWRMGEEQVEYFLKALADNPKVRWTFLLMHKPLWTNPGEEGADGKAAFERIEDALKGRNYTVFAGHTHQYTREVRRGMEYYQLATTGGGSDMRGPLFGEVDHFMWVTVGAGAPTVASVQMDGIMDPDSVTPATRGLADKIDGAVPRQVSAVVAVEAVLGYFNMRFSGKNETALPLYASVGFDRSGPFRIVSAPGEVTLAPGSATEFAVSFKADQPVPVDGLADIPYEWRVAARPTGAREVELKGNSAIGFERPRPAKRAPADIRVDGKLGDWKEFPCEALNPRTTPGPGLWRGPEDSSFRFNVAWDEKFVYVAARVRDDSLVVAPGMDPWNQDGIHVGLAGRTELDWDVDAMGKEQSVFLSPGKSAKGTVLWGPEWMPKGLQVACIATKGGFDVEVGVPVEAIQEGPDKPWKALRVVMGVYDFDKDTGGAVNPAGNNGTYVYWQTDYKSTSGTPQSGAFIRR